MGQYYILANVDKEEFLSTYDFGAGAKLMEFAYPMGPSIVASALCILLADGNNRGGGDLHTDNPIVGSWAFNRVVVAGDYADETPEFSTEKNIYHLANESWRNVAVDVFCAMADDSLFAEEYATELLDRYSHIYAPAITAIATAHKLRQYGNGKNPYPKLEERAQYFFGKLYPDKNSDYYKVINGIVKHSHEVEHADLVRFENGLEYMVDLKKQKQITELEKQVKELQEKLDKLKTP